MSKTGDDLLNSVKITITEPNNQVLLTDDRILEFANQEIGGIVLPIIIQMNQEYFVYKELEAVVPDQLMYSIPYRAIGRILRDLKMTDGSQTWDMAKIALEDEHLLNFSATPFGFYFRGDKIMLVQTPKGSNLRLIKYYLLRPGKLVKTDAAAKITGVSGNVITVDLVPATFSTGNTIDFIQGRQGNSTLLMDSVITNIAGNQITVSAVPDASAGDIADPIAGDYISMSEQSPVVQLPDESFAYLTALTAKRCLEAVGDFDGAKQIDDGIPEKRRQLQNMLSPRIEGESTKIVQRFGLLRGNRLRYRRGFYY